MVMLGGFNAYVATPLIEDTLSISAKLKYYDKAAFDLKWPTPVWNNNNQRPDNYQIASHSPQVLLLAWVLVLGLIGQ